MIQLKRLLFFALPLVLLASCGKDDIGGEPGSGTTPGDGGDIRFEIGFAPQTRVATAPDFTSTWEDGDEIGIFAVANGQPLSHTASGNYIHNAKLTYSSANGGEWAQETALFWPTTADHISTLDFYAYYPYDATATDPTVISFNVLTDQSAAGDYSKSDLLTAKSTGPNSSTNGWSKDNGPVTLIFSHALAMVEVTLDGAINPNEDIIVKLVGIQAGATLNLGAVDAANPGAEVSLAQSDNSLPGITMYYVGQEGDADYYNKYTFRAVVPAQELEQDSRVAFITNGDMILQSSALTAAVPLVAGQAERFNQTLSFFIPTVLIPAAGKTFQMGDTIVAAPVHTVGFTKDFHMGKYQVTNAQYAEFLNAKGVQGGTSMYNPGWGKYMNAGLCTWGEHDGQALIFDSNGTGSDWGLNWNGNKWSPASGCDNRPVIWVTWYGAKAYADWVTESTDIDCYLPTEAQWEYACRAGSTEEYGIGINNEQITSDNLDSYGWYSSNSANRTHTVGEKKPNAYGLYDMHGNVLEWCSDWYGFYDSNPITDPIGPASGDFHVLRGGGWDLYALICRSAYRYSAPPRSAFNFYGFRVVFVP